MLVELNHNWNIKLQNNQENFELCSVALPFDAGTRFPFDENSSAGIEEGFCFKGTLDFEKMIQVPSAEHNILRLDGIRGAYSVFADSDMLYSCPWSICSHDVDLSVYAGNSISLRICVSNAGAPQSRYYRGCGIITPPLLISKPALHFDERSLVNNFAKDRLETYICLNGAACEKQAEVLMQLFDASDSLLRETKESVDFDAVALKLNSGLTDVKLWSPEQPVLYKQKLSLLLNGKTIDCIERQIGFKELILDGALYINGIETKLQGACLHEDCGALGSEFYEDIWEYRLQMLKETGVNAVKISHTSPLPQFVALCDRIGLYVIVELFDEWRMKKRKDNNSFADYFDELYKENVERTVRDLRNSPSVIAWSIGNEIFDFNSEDGQNLARELASAIRDLSALPVLCSGANGAKDYLDITDSHYQNFPAQNGSRLQLAGESTCWHNNYIPIRDNKHFIGDFIWTGFDYLGETWLLQNKNGLCHGAECGAFTSCGKLKPQGAARAALWSKKPFLKLFAERAIPDMNEFWGWLSQGRELSAAKRIIAYTNAAEIEFISGEKTEKQFCNMDIVESFALTRGQEGKHIVFPRIEYSDEAFVSAFCKFSGIKDTLSLSAAADKINVSMLHQGRISVLRISLCDADDNICLSADDFVKLSYSGNGHILCSDNGNMYDNGNYYTGSKRLYQGELTVYIADITNKDQLEIEIDSLRKTVVL